MLNIALFTAIFLLWLFSRQSHFNLALIILFYYVGYFFLQPTAPHSVYWAEYYVMQTALDGLVVLACCYLSTFCHVLRGVVLCYAVIVGTSQLSQQLMLINPDIFMRVFEVRQWLSVPVDLLFALLGSGRGGCLLRFANRVLLDYNQRYVDHSRGAKTK